MTTGNIISIIALCVTVFFSGFALFYSIKNNKRTDSKDIERRIKETVEINTKLDYITKNTNEIKNELSSMKEDIKSHNDRILIVEQKYHSVQKHIDDIEDRVTNLEKEG